MAVDGRTQIGFIAARFVEHATVEILFLYIRLDYLRKGIGNQLVRYFENWIRKQHPEIERIIVDTAVIIEKRLIFFTNLKVLQPVSGVSEKTTGSHR